MISRRTFVAQAGGLGMALVGGPSLWGQLGAASPPKMTIYKSPTCGCCEKWVDHVKAAGFAVEVHDDDDMDTVKDSLGVPKGVRSCHTSQVDKYLVEGHVPAEDILRLLRQRPKVAGLAVPDMPSSSPGMAVPGAPKEPFQVVSFQPNGATALYAQH